MKVYKHTVQYYETDKMGVTHHSNYIRWMEEARVDYLEKIGWSFVKLEEDGFVSPIIDVNGKFRRSTTFADEILIKLFVREVKGAKFVIDYVMTNAADGKVVFEGASEHCFIRDNGRPLRIEKELPGFFSTLSELIDNPPYEDWKASDCVECGQCETVCPQHLPVIELLKEAVDKFGK